MSTDFQEEKPTRAPIYWSDEAVTYLGLDRIHARPREALYKLVKNKSLRPAKIGRQLAFRKDDLDNLLERGSRTSRRGRPRGSFNRRAS